MVMKICLQSFPDGTLIDWGRHTPRSVNQTPFGGAKFYAGEDAEILNLVLKHTASAVPDHKRK